MHSLPVRASTVIFSSDQTLQLVTAIKLGEVEKQRLAYQAHSAKSVETTTTESAPPTRASLIAKVELLAAMIKEWTEPTNKRSSGSIVIGGKLDLSNLEFWLQQAKRDATFDVSMLEGWTATLETHIKRTNMRFDAAKLFGMLCDEWMKSGDSGVGGDSSVAKDEDGQDVDEGMESDGSYEYVDVGKKDIATQKKKVQSTILEECPLDIAVLNQYLEELFASEAATQVLQRVRAILQSYGPILARKTITPHEVKIAIQGLLLSDLMNQDQRATLEEAQKTPVVLEELSTVLNMRLSTLDSWGWPEEGLAADIRRTSDGEFRESTDPELVDGILLHYLGVAWQIKLKFALRLIFDSSAWKQRPSELSASARMRCDAQLSIVYQDGPKISIDRHRETTQRRSFFLNKLHGTVESTTVHGNAELGLELDENVPSYAKQKLLHIFTTEGRLNQALRGSHAMSQSSLESLGPSLPHTAILVIMAFLGIPQSWLTFFQAFLAMPTIFPDDAQSRTRQRGTPTSYALSTVCEEAVLFIMDFAVNQRADGLSLYRMHDEMWLCDSDAQRCAKAWAEMVQYAGIVGMTFDLSKTGSVYLGPEPEAMSLLPKGHFRWGFLTFDLQKARFVVDQELVDNQIAEMRRQLGFTKSVLGWVTAYNKGMAYFMRNFGSTPAICFEEAHSIDILDTFKRIQHELLPGFEQGPTAYLRKTLEERFGIHDLPEGYFYFPLSSGGLELRNILLSLFALSKYGKPLLNIDGKGRAGDSTSMASRNSAGCYEVEDAPASEKFKNKAANDHKDYAHAKYRWEITDEPWQKEEFISLEEFLSCRESRSATWGNLYSEMLQTARPKDLAPVPMVSAQVPSAIFFQSMSGMGSWNGMDWYEKWVVSMYGEGVAKRFGRLDIVDEKLIPVGLVDLLKKSKSKL